MQDDIRVRKNLTLTPGRALRAADARQRLGEHRSALRRHVGAVHERPDDAARQRGMFYDWLPTATYDQALRVDGFHQQELNIVDPSFPDPGTGGIVPPVNRYVLGGAFRRCRGSRASAPASIRRSRKSTRVSATYSYQRGSRLARGANLNPPVDGVRPDPAFANIIDVVSDAASRQHQLQVDANINPGALLPAVQGAADQLEARRRCSSTTRWRSPQQHRRTVQRAADRDPRHGVGAGRRWEWRRRVRYSPA